MIKLMKLELSQSSYEIENLNHLLSLSMTKVSDKKKYFLYPIYRYLTICGILTPMFVFHIL